MRRWAVVWIAILLLPAATASHDGRPGEIREDNVEISISPDVPAVLPPANVTVSIAVHNGLQEAKRVDGAVIASFPESRTLLQINRSLDAGETWTADTTLQVDRTGEYPMTFISEDEDHGFGGTPEYIRVRQATVVGMVPVDVQLRDHDPRDPLVVTPGSETTLELEMTSLADRPIHDLEVTLRSPFDVNATVDTLAAGETETVELVKEWGTWSLSGGRRGIVEVQGGERGGGFPVRARVEARIDGETVHQDLWQAGQDPPRRFELQGERITQTGFTVVRGITEVDRRTPFVLVLASGGDALSTHAEVTFRLAGMSNLERKFTEDLSVDGGEIVTVTRTWRPPASGSWIIGWESSLSSGTEGVSFSVAGPLRAPGAGQIEGSFGGSGIRDAFFDGSPIEVERGAATTVSIPVEATEDVRVDRVSVGTQGVPYQGPVSVDDIVQVVGGSSFSMERGDVRTVDVTVRPVASGHYPIYGVFDSTEGLAVLRSDNTLVVPTSSGAGGLALLPAVFGAALLVGQYSWRRFGVE